MFSHAPGGTRAAEEIPLFGRSLHEIGQSPGLSPGDRGSQLAQQCPPLSLLQCLVGPLPLQCRERLLSEPTFLLPGQPVSWASVFSLKRSCEVVSAVIQLVPPTFYLGGHVK